MKRSVLLCVLCLMLVRLAPVCAQPATEPAGPMQLRLAYYDQKMRQMGQPPALEYGNGFMLLEIKWISPFKEKDDVYYRVWIRGQDKDWGSANAPQGVDEAGEKGWRQYAYLGRVREGASSGARMKLDLRYRPAGLSSHPVQEGGATGLVQLPEAMPLPPGNHSFTLCVQRVGPGTAIENATAPLNVTIKPNTAFAIIDGISDHQVFQRSTKKTGDISFRAITPSPKTPWKAAVALSGKTIASASGSSVSAVTQIAIRDVPVGGPYDVQVIAGNTTRDFTDVYVGDIWIVSGQSNAVGCGYDQAFAAQPMPGVQGLQPKYGQLEWAIARDGFFQQTVGAWVTAAQTFYVETKVPVGLVGHAAGSKGMDYFYDSSRSDPYFLRPLVERFGVGAAAFFWYQGESDTFDAAMQESYPAKLDGLVKAMRSVTQNPQLVVGICQLGRYTWFRDDHFATMREVQRKYVLKDPRSALYSTLPYDVNAKDKIHLLSEGYVGLGKQIGAQMTELERSGQVVSPGPAVKEAKFLDASRTRLAVTFANGEGLQGNASAEEWFVTDQSHRGFKDGGFVEISSITIDPAKQQVLIDLKSPPAGASALSYGYRSDVGGSLANAKGHPAACFVRVPIVE